MGAVLVEVVVHVLNHFEQRTLDIDPETSDLGLGVKVFSWIIRPEFMVVSLSLSLSLCVCVCVRARACVLPIPAATICRYIFPHDPVSNQETGVYIAKYIACTGLTSCWLDKGVCVCVCVNSGITTQITGYHTRWWQVISMTSELVIKRRFQVKLALYLSPRYRLSQSRAGAIIINWFLLCMSTTQILITYSHCPLDLSPGSGDDDGQLLS